MFRCVLFTGSAIKLFDINSVISTVSPVILKYF
jgi:hypothetical protein